MSVFELEYTVCILQRDAFSFAAKSHRQENGNPQLEIDINTNDVTWTLTNLDGGVPETIAGAPQADRVDFYFTRDYLKENHSYFPTPNAQRNTSLKLSPTNSSGTERKEGKRVRIAQPIFRFYPVDSVRLTVNKTPAFEAHASNAYLHLDIETGPAKYYGSEIFEVHFGIEADYTVTPFQGSGSSQAQLIMSHEMYATILEELKWIQ